MPTRRFSASLPPPPAHTHLIQYDPDRHMVISAKAGGLIVRDDQERRREGGGGGGGEAAKKDE